MHCSKPGPIKLDLGFSMWLASYLLISHLLATIVVFQLELGIYFSFGLVVVVLYSLIYHWKRDIQQMQPNSVIGVDWSYEKGWLVRFRSGKNLKAELSPTSLVSRWLVVLHFTTQSSGRHMVAVAGDAIDSNRLRRLKVLLKMHNHFSV
jgi:hypothetical protein